MGSLTVPKELSSRLLAGWALTLLVVQHALSRIGTARECWRRHSRDERDNDESKYRALAGQESAPIGVVTTPGTKKPRYVRAERPRPLASSSLADMNF